VYHQPVVSTPSRPLRTLVHLRQHQERVSSSALSEQRTAHQASLATVEERRAEARRALGELRDGRFTAGVEPARHLEIAAAYAQRRRRALGELHAQIRQAQEQAGVRSRLVDAARTATLEAHRLRSAAEKLQLRAADLVRRRQLRDED
jgi:hypothetical protein